MNKEEIFQQIRGKLIVSCQANEEENPFNPPEKIPQPHSKKRWRILKCLSSANPQLKLL